MKKKNKANCSTYKPKMILLSVLMSPVINEGKVLLLVIVSAYIVQHMQNFTGVACLINVCFILVSEKSSWSSFGSLDDYNFLL